MRQCQRPGGLWAAGLHTALRRGPSFPGLPKQEIVSRQHRCADSRQEDRVSRPERNQRAADLVRYLQVGEIEAVDIELDYVRPVVEINDDVVSVSETEDEDIDIAARGATAQGVVPGSTYEAIGLCCTNPVRDSSRESSVVAGMHEQTDTPDLQDQELAGL